MSKFLTCSELSHAFEKMFEASERRLILISPFIRLNDRIKSALCAKRHNHKLQITLVFGSREKDLAKSMGKEDLAFFTDFPNIEIRYEKRLHAKYYANDFSAILTSMNLSNCARDHYIEAGILMKSSLLGGVVDIMTEDCIDKQTATYFDDVISKSALLFRKTPEYDGGIMGIGKSYMGSTERLNNLDAFFDPSASRIP